MVRAPSNKKVSYDAVVAGVKQQTTLSSERKATSGWQEAISKQRADAGEEAERCASSPVLTDWDILDVSVAIAEPCVKATRAEMGSEQKAAGSMQRSSVQPAADGEQPLGAVAENIAHDVEHNGELVV